MKKKIAFNNKNNYKLSGIIEIPENRKPRTFALLAHCFTCSKNFKAIENISTSLSDKGFGVLRFDFTGLGESEGDFSDTNFSSNVEDIYAACDFLKDNYSPPEILIGHSLGGAAVLMSASEIDSCKAVVTIASPSKPDHVLKHIDQSLETIKKEGVAEVSIEGRKFKIKNQFVEDLNKQQVQDKIRNLKMPLLIFHAPFDNIVGIDNASDIFLAAKHPKSFISLDTADHLLSNPEDSSYAGSVISAWADKYVNTLEDSKKDLGNFQVAVETFQNGYYTEISTKKHFLTSDEPEDLGGTDKGPTPYELLLSALGSCTNITLRMYADRKEMPLDSIITRLKYEKVHLEDCEDCEDKNTKVDFIERELELIGNLSDKQINRLIEIADKCPVHRTLEAKVHTKTSLK